MRRRPDEEAACEITRVSYGEGGARCCFDFVPMMPLPMPEMTPNDDVNMEVSEEKSIL